MFEYSLFLPFIYFFYIETANRSLEEVDLIFAKGYLENMSYVCASKELPFLSDEEIDGKARKLGIKIDETVASNSDEEVVDEKVREEEKHRESARRYSGSEGSGMA